mgnify:CR=1 FL=1
MAERMVFLGFGKYVRADKIVAPIRSLEPFAIPLRNLPEFAVAR